MRVGKRKHVQEARRSHDMSGGAMDKAVRHFSTGGQGIGKAPQQSSTAVAHSKCRSGPVAV